MPPTSDQHQAARRAVERAQEATGLSQIALAAALGVRPSTLWRWLSGESRMYPPALRLLRAYALVPDLAFVLEHDA